MSLVACLFVTVGLHRILLLPDRNSQLCRPKNPLLRKVKEIKVLPQEGRGIEKTAKILPDRRTDRTLPIVDSNRNGRLRQSGVSYPNFSENPIDCQGEIHSHSLNRKDRQRTTKLSLWRLDKSRKNC
ncbi:hypothetical protein [Tychonema sp. LEGE 07203]|uniref:hypothetical protein n=1 Tax=Tychonema sp. LEGE 07203 TaxID=1828671 RepID=UPI001882F9F2|nr:hypothetical protein [Tychonema sp. LEGE 07203]MBE9093506.1 hypothetical protein [Tychonema sp. LEGE 07203]